MQPTRLQIAIMQELVVSVNQEKRKVTFAMRTVISAVVLATVSVLGVFAPGSAHAQGAVIAHDWNGRVFSAHADVRTGEVLTFRGVSHVVTWTNSLPAAGETTFGISAPFIPVIFNGKTVVFS